MTLTGVTRQVRLLPLASLYRAPSAPLVTMHVPLFPAVLLVAVLALLFAPHVSGQSTKPLLGALLIGEQAAFPWSR